MNYLSDSQKTFWKENSYLVLPGLFANMQKELEEWGKNLEQAEPDGKMIISYEAANPDQISRIEDFIHLDPKLKEIFFESKLVEIISEIFEEPAVLYKERINFKLPGGGPHSAHQDGVAFEAGMEMKFDKSTKPYVSFMLSIDESNEENGCLELAPNWSVDRDEILDMEFPDQENPNFSKIKGDIEDSIDWVKIPTKPGDVVLFTERLPHRSKANKSDISRKILYGVYNPSSLGDKRETYYNNKRANINDPRYLVGNPHAPA